MLWTNSLEQKLLIYRQLLYLKIIFSQVFPKCSTKFSEKTLLKEHLWMAIFEISIVKFWGWFSFFSAAVICVTTITWIFWDKKEILHGAYCLFKVLILNFFETHILLCFLLKSAVNCVTTHSIAVFTKLLWLTAVVSWWSWVND